MTRAVIITNPAAGRSAEADLALVRRRLTEVGVVVDVATTGGRGDAERLAREAVSDGAELLIAHGGDGTVMEVAGVLVGTERPIGILPAGTGNLLAGNLGMRRSAQAAVDVILAGKTRAIDVGRMESTTGARYFAVAAGVGFDAQLMHQTAQHHKRTFGVGAYVATAVGLATAITRATVRIETDQTVFEGQAAIVLVANCRDLITGVFQLHPAIEPDDGFLDVAVLDAATLPGAARVAWRLFTRRPQSDPGITFLRARTVRVVADPVLPAQADGDAAGHSPIAIEILPRALRVLAPTHD
ncbi:MAG: diacylglycerol kinase family lipid kinase [Gemmatimonadales bacterium]|nr:diacylglycerol kinase family lipid kinase [Gemmatimonadales bacterium]